MSKKKDGGHEYTYPNHQPSISPIKKNISPKWTRADQSLHSLHSVIKSQQSIGPYKICLGVMSNKWEHLINSYKISVSGNVWGKKVIDQMLHYSFTLWQYRNDALHNSNGNPCDATIAMDNKIKLLYSNGSFTTSINDHYLFRYPLHRILMWSQFSKTKWLQMVHEAISFHRSCDIPDTQTHIHTFFSNVSP